MVVVLSFFIDERVLIVGRDDCDFIGYSVCVVVILVRDDLCWLVWVREVCDVLI